MDTQVRNSKGRSRYELLVDGEVVGVVDYQVEGEQVVMPRTEVDEERRGKGLGAELVQGALDDVRSSGRKVVPSCPFVRDFIDDHPEYADLVA